MKKNPKLVQTWGAVTSYFRFLFKVLEFVGNEPTREDLVDLGGLS